MIDIVAKLRREDTDFRLNDKALRAYFWNIRNFAMK